MFYVYFYVMYETMYYIKHYFLEDKVAAMLMLISHFIPPKGMLRLNKKYYKVSIADSKDSIIRHVTVCYSKYDKSVKSNFCPQ